MANWLQLWIRSIHQGNTSLHTSTYFWLGILTYRLILSILNSISCYSIIKLLYHNNPSIRKSTSHSKFTFSVTIFCLVFYIPLHSPPPMIVDIPREFTGRKFYIPRQKRHGRKVQGKFPKGYDFRLPFQFFQNFLFPPIVIIAFRFRVGLNLLSYSYDHVSFEIFNVMDQNVESK